MKTGQPPRTGLSLGIAVLAAVVVAVSLMALPLKWGIVAALLGLAMLAIAVIDANTFIIPNWLSLPAIPAGLLASGRLLESDVSGVVDIGHVAGAIVGAVALWAIAILYRLWRSSDGLGLGDVKLAGAAGAWTGIEHIPLVLFLASSTALAFVLTLAITRRERPSSTTMVPLGAFLAPAIWLTWILSKRWDLVW